MVSTSAQIFLVVFMLGLAPAPAGPQGGQGGCYDKGSLVFRGFKEYLLLHELEIWFQGLSGL